MADKNQTTRIKLPVAKLIVTCEENNVAIKLAEEISAKQSNIIYSRIDEKILTLLTVGRLVSELSDLASEIEKFPGVKSVKLEKEAMDPFICTPEIPILLETKVSGVDMEVQPLRSYPIPCAIAGCGLSCCYL